MSVLRPIAGLAAGPLRFAAAESERMLSRLRVVIVVLLLLVPTYHVASEGLADPIYRWGFALDCGFLVAAIAIMLAQHRVHYAEWHGRATSLFDVVLVSAVLLVFTEAGGIQAGMYNRSTFPVYCVALAASGLRLDFGAVLVAGIGSCVGYGAVVWRSLVHPSAAAIPAAEIPGVLFDQTNRFMVLFIAALIALAIVRVGQRLVELASLDGVTHALNRTAFDTALRHGVERARRHGERFVLALVGLDHLKALNEEHGHNRGDEALRLLSRRLGATVRKSDVIARYGGDEFALLLPQAKADDVARRLNDIRATLAEHGLTIGAQHLPLTITAGIACFPEDGTEELTLYDIADSRLRAGKRAGRDRVVGPA